MIVILNGGLGNQLFQLSHAIHLSKELGLKVTLDKSILDNKWFQRVLRQTPTDYGLDDFTWDADVNVSSSKATLLLVLLSKIFSKVSNGRVNIIGGDCVNGLSKYFLGYFQNINLAKQYSQLIHFREVDNKNKLIGEEISYNNSVCLHVRRGDYLALNNYYASCSLRYYESVIEQCPIDSKVYVFSNDIKWCKTSGVFPDGSVFIDHNKASNAYLDMYLLSKGKYLGVANSTFSVWAAIFSNANVYCPSEYYLGRPNDLKLDAWRVINNGK
ncbi:alpha-1,2-fucosyltransferase [Aeromonas enteropelogenes]|uniref:alpha-1,2-fucosyltransferase n=1 Tax=Aeromonas enteropelogenes TaxID=29489 RepID=UPI003B9F46C7